MFSKVEKKNSNLCENFANFAWK